jgi:hypothetical protein
LRTSKNGHTTEHTPPTSEGSSEVHENTTASSNQDLHGSKDITNNKVQSTSISTSNSNTTGSGVSLEQDNRDDNEDEDDDDDNEYVNTMGDHTLQDLVDMAKLGVVDKIFKTRGTGGRHFNVRNSIGIAEDGIWYTNILVRHLLPTYKLLPNYSSSVRFIAGLENTSTSNTLMPNKTSMI